MLLNVIIARIGRVHRSVVSICLSDEESNAGGWYVLDVAVSREMAIYLHHDVCGMFLIHPPFSTVVFVAIGIFIGSLRNLYCLLILYSRISCST